MNEFFSFLRTCAIRQAHKVTDSSSANSVEMVHPFGIIDFKSKRIRLLDLRATIEIVVIKHQDLRNSSHFFSVKRQLALRVGVAVVIDQVVMPVAITVDVDRDALIRCDLGLYLSMEGSDVLQLLAQALPGEAPAC